MLYQQAAEVKMVGYITPAHGIAQRLSEKWRHFAFASAVIIFSTSLFCVGVPIAALGQAYQNRVVAKKKHKALLVVFECMGMGISVRDFGSQLRSGNAACVVVWCVLLFKKKTLQQRSGLRSPLARVGREAIVRQKRNRNPRKKKYVAGKSMNVDGLSRDVLASSRVP